MDETNIAKREWSIREYREGDEEQMLELRGIVTGDPKNRQWWKWMYQDSPAGPALIFLAEANQKIVGQYVGVPVNLKIGNQTRKGGHGIDLMVHPEYRHQGIFRTLGMTMAQTPEAHGSSISYGTPNDQSRPGFTKWLQDNEICAVPSLVKVIDWSKALKSRYGIPVFAGNLLGFVREHITHRISFLQNTDVEIEPVSSFDERIDKFWLEASRIKNIMVIKDMKYLNWRYVAKPGNEYKIFIAKRQDEITGFIVIKLERGVPNRGLIVDLLTLPGEDTVTKALTTRAVGYLKEEGAAMVSCWMLPDTPYYRTLRKLGFMRRSSRPLCARIFDPDISKEFVTNPGNWYYVMGDEDVL